MDSYRLSSIQRVQSQISGLVHHGRCWKGFKRGGEGILNFKRPLYFGSISFVIHFIMACALLFFFFGKCIADFLPKRQRGGGGGGGGGW